MQRLVDRFRALLYRLGITYENLCRECGYDLQCYSKCLNCEAKKREHSGFFTDYDSSDDWG